MLTRREFTRVAATCAGAAMLCLAGCGGQSDGPAPGTRASSNAGVDGQMSRTIFAFDTVVTIKATGSPETMQALCDRCAYFESIFSRTIATSDIGRVNAAGGKPVEVASETADLVSKALRYCEESDGRFDITIGAVSTLWDFKEGIVPEPAAIQEAVKHIGYANVQVEGTTITLADPDAKLDLGGIAKGYIADDLCQMLIDAGCTSGIVNLGGNVKTVGARPDGASWRVGVQDPNGGPNDLIGTAESEDSSVVTSGLYERQFEKNGERYWHILDPKSGYPVQTDLVSATIFSADSIDGDGYTKPLFMLGRDAALAWVEAKDGIEALLIDANGTILQTSGCNAELM